MSVPSIETKIYQAIKARVASLPMAAIYEVVWTTGPGTYTPSPLKPYLRCTWTPNVTLRRSTGARDPSRRPGVLQIDVMDTLVRGSDVARETAGQIAQHFPADRAMTFMGIKAQVLKAPSVMAPSVGTHVQVPIQIEIEAYE